MFRDNKQAHMAIAWLLDDVKGGRLWTVDGPTREALRAMDALQKGEGPPWSKGEALMLRVAFDIWNGAGHADFSAMLGTLDSDNLGQVSGLLQAMVAGPHGVDAWLYLEGVIEAPAERDDPKVWSLSEWARWRARRRKKRE